MLAGAAPPARATAPRPPYDPYAASQGLLIDEAHARSLAAGRPVLEPVTQAVAGDEIEVTVTFSSLLASPRAERKGGEEVAAQGRKDEAVPTGRPARWVPQAWSAPAVALLAFVLAGGGTAWFLLPRAAVTSPLALFARLGPFAVGRAEAPSPEATPPQGEPPVPAAAQAALPPADPAPRRAATGTATAPRGKVALAREWKLARRTPAHRR